LENRGKVFVFIDITEAVFKEKRGVRDPLLELTITSTYLIDDAEVSSPPQTQREKGGVGKVSPIGWAHYYLSANNGQPIGKGRVRRGGGKGRELTLCFRIDMLWSMGIGQPRA
jgi:hypothetical protein